MYEAFYDLKEKPFNLSPDPRFIYFTEEHYEALASLVYAIRERKGFSVLCGEVGTGKTTLLRALLGLLERVGILSAFIFNPILSRSEFFECLLAEFNLKCDFTSKIQALKKVNALLLERYRQGRITVLIIDEAQNLSAEILEEIRLLTNLETSSEKLLQIILVGQPELSLRLDSPNLRQLKQRISLRCSLEPLTLSETAEYIRTRLRIAGLLNQEIFSDSCIAEIYRCSEGIPRLINTICDNALVTGFASNLKTIDVKIIDEVAEDLRLIRRRKLGSELSAPPNENGKGSRGNAPTEPILDPEGVERFLKFVNRLKERAREGAKA